MKQSKVGVVMVVQNDEETIERSVRSFYSQVEKIVVSTDPRLGWSGKAISPDSTIDRIRSLDVDNKIDILQGNFCDFQHPQTSETIQRQITADWLSNRIPGLDWVCQIDADEEFLDFDRVLEFLGRAPNWSRGVMWMAAQVFNLLDDERVLVVTDHDGHIITTRFFLAHRPFGRLVTHRNPAIVPFRLNRQTLRLNELLFRTNSVTNFIPTFDDTANSGGLCLHYPFGKSEARIAEKLETWGHATDFDTDSFFKLWKRTKHNWADVKNFHPLNGPVWPALRAMTIAELRSSISKGITSTRSA